MPIATLNYFNVWTWVPNTCFYCVLAIGKRWQTRIPGVSSSLLAMTENGPDGCRGRLVGWNSCLLFQTTVALSRCVGKSFTKCMYSLKTKKENQAFWLDTRHSMSVDTQYNVLLTGVPITFSNQIPLAVGLYGGGVLLNYHNRIHIMWSWVAWFAALVLVADCLGNML